MIYEQISEHRWRTFFLFLFFTLFIGFVAFLVGFAFFGSDAAFVFLLIAGILAILYGVVGYYAGDKIVLKLSGAKPAPYEKYPYLHNIVEALAIGAGIPKPKVYVVEDDAPNAFATGRDQNHASIAVTTGLLKLMNREELEGVIAHEISHIRNKDVKVMTLAAILAGVIMILIDLAWRMLWWGGPRERRSGLEIIVGILALIFAPIIAQMIKLAISRQREYLADASAALLTHYPEGLANALEKIAAYGKPVKRATSSTAHLYITNPLRRDWLSRLFSTHPPIEERIKRLRRMAFQQ